jgi:outer membrane protein assembly factor BamB
MSGAIRGGIAADDRAIYVVSQGGEVAAFTADGATLWRKQPTRPDFDGKNQVPIEGYAAPVVASELLVVPFARDTYYPVPALLALDRTTGAIRWRAQGRGKDDWGNIRSTPALVGGTLVYAEPYSGDVVGVDAAAGRVLYRQTVGGCYFPQYASPASAGELAYVPRFDGVLYAVRVRDGGVAWKMYLGDKAQAGTQVPLAAKSCEWDVPSGSPLYSPVAVAPDGTVLAGNGAGTLFAIEEQR